MAGRAVLYPFLLAAFPILSLYAHNVHEVRPQELLAPLAAVTGLAAATWGLLGLAIGRKWHKAGLLAIPPLVLFYAAGSVPLESLSESLGDFAIEHDMKAVWLLPLELAAIEVVIACSAIGLIAWRVREPAAAGRTGALNRFALILALMPILAVATSRSWFSGQQVSAIRGAFDVPMEAGDALLTRPDIYYIILDGFGRDDVLEEIYDFDAGPFLETLEHHGFVVARASTSNYGQTRLSLASSLNGSYLDDLRSPTAADEDPLRDLIQGNGLVRALRGLGYTIIDFDSGYHLTEDLGSDVRLGPHSWGLGEFQLLLIRGTAIAYFLPEHLARDPFAQARVRITTILDRLPGIAQRPEPTFTFAHILAPHPPFLFDAQGKPTASASLTFSLNDGDEFQDPDPRAYIDGYRDQASFLAKQVESMVQRLLASSPTPPIVIIQADHGPGSRMSHRDVHKTDLHERFSILNAYHLPGVDPKAIPQDITPVNSFRLVLNRYFRAELPMLPNRSYYATWWKPFDFIDITQPLAERNGPRAGARPLEQPPAPKPSATPPSRVTSACDHDPDADNEGARPAW
ncbi:MAG: hypothetical protein U0800_01225 [Isosphaeraceae bacterium]